MTQPDAQRRARSRNILAITTHPTPFKTAPPAQQKKGLQSSWVIQDSNQWWAKSERLISTKGKDPNAQEVIRRLRDMNEFLNSHPSVTPTHVRRNTRPYLPQECSRLRYLRNHEHRKGIFETAVHAQQMGARGGRRCSAARCKEGDVAQDCPRNLSGQSCSILFHYRL